DDVGGRPPPPWIASRLARIAPPLRRSQATREIVEEHAVPAGGGSGRAAVPERPGDGESSERRNRQRNDSNAIGQPASLEDPQSRNPITLLTRRRRNWSAAVNGRRSKR
ncbi:MAG: hypothetical protein JWO74_1984, partial [Solirubrobacterales bacterium]|nr:hypothetical protein [Solirubrobacterales bacterium]